MHFLETTSSVCLNECGVFGFRYEELIDHTKSLSGRTYKLVTQLLEHAQAQATR